MKFVFFTFRILSSWTFSSSNRLYFDSMGKSYIDLYHSFPLHSYFRLYNLKSPSLLKITSVNYFLFSFACFSKQSNMGSIRNSWAACLHIGHCHFGTSALLFNKIKLFKSKTVKCLQNVVLTGYSSGWKVIEQNKDVFTLSRVTYSENRKELFSKWAESLNSYSLSWASWRICEKFFSSTTYAPRIWFYSSILLSFSPLLKVSCLSERMSLFFPGTTNLVTFRISSLRYFNEDCLCSGLNSFTRELFIISEQASGKRFKLLVKLFGSFFNLMHLI